MLLFVHIPYRVKYSIMYCNKDTVRAMTIDTTKEHQKSAVRRGSRSEGAWC
jgi:uncharacterized protein YlbG (UPF0298 family)